MKKALILLAVVVLMFSALSIAPTGSGVAVAQNRHVFVEEFTGSWCGFCPRGAWALEQLAKKYPGQVVEVSYHGGSTSEPMRTNQGDSMIASKGFPNGAVPGFPDGWTARENIGSKWDIDPALWVNPSIAFQTQGGAVDTMVGKPAVASVSITSLSYNESTNTVTATVTSTFKSAMSGDFRINLLITEDSLSGDPGTQWDQTSYYYNDATSPFYQMGQDLGNHALISGWQHMHVFREAVGGVKGTAGVIANPTVAGTAYTKTYTFKLPSTIVDTNHIHFIAIVHQYSATDKTKNAVLDAFETDGFKVPTPKPEVTIDITSDKPQSMWAKAGGTTTFNLTVKNTNSASVAVKEDARLVGTLPTGWSVSMNPQSFTLNAGASQNVAVTVTAPSNQANYVSPTIDFVPTVTDAIALERTYGFNMLSDNTKNVVYTATGTYSDSALVRSAMKGSLGPVTAAMALDNQTWQTFDPSKFDMMTFADYPVLDYPSDSSYDFPRVLPTIISMLEKGKSVMVTSYYSGYGALASAPYMTDAATSFFGDTLGVQLQGGVYTTRNNGSSYTSYKINAVTSDVIGAGIPALLGNQSSSKLLIPIQSVFSTPMPGTSVPVLYSDGVTDNVIGLKYKSAAGGHFVLYSMPLDNISVPKWADTLASRSYAWMAGTLVDQNSGVQLPNVAASNFAASSNPFHTATQISYTAAEGEHDVTFSAFDLLGREVAKLSPKVSGSTVTATFDANRLAAGTYVIVKHSSTGSEELRVVNQ